MSLCLLNIYFIFQFYFLINKRNISRMHVEDAFSISNLEINPYENKPYSTNYYKILETRKKLPVYERKDEIINTVKENQVTVIEGNTGSGKTTQIPQFLLQSGICDTSHCIVCTQPRRVAATSIAARVADEMDCKLGGIVGYSVRYDDQTSNETKLIYMTDGLLLRDFVTDPLINKYGIVIIDEAHERGVNSDIILGLLKIAAKSRSDLKIVIMSATLEAQKFTNFFTNNSIPPHLSIPGRLHKVDIVYSQADVENYTKATVDTVVQIHQHNESGDILVFLTGEEEIENCAAEIRQKCTPASAMSANITEVVVLPLYASLNPKDQDKVFTPPKENIRKIILATNIAETSVTIDGVVYVVDCGLVKQSQYNPTLRMSILQPVNISKASATQRAGRAGRTRNGFCWRLYTKQVFDEALPEQSVPEIQRSDLAAVILLMLAVGVRDIVNFPYIDAPRQKLLKDAISELIHLGALSSSGDLTETGKLMAQMPLSPSLSRSLLASADFGCTAEVASVVAIVGEQGQFFLRPKMKQAEADAARAQFAVPNSDHLTMLNALEIFMLSPTREFCESNYLNYRALSGAMKARGQLISLLQRFDIPITSIPFTNPQRGPLIIQALLQGTFIKVAMKDKNGYAFPFSDRTAVVHPSSVLYRSKYPEWVLYTEFLFTDKYYLRTVSGINSSWLIPAAPKYFVLKAMPEGPVKNAIARLKAEYDSKQGA